MSFLFSAGKVGLYIRTSKVTEKRAKAALSKCFLCPPSTGPGTEGASLNASFPCTFPEGFQALCLNALAQPLPSLEPSY